MSWTPIYPAPEAGKGAPSPATVTVNRPGGRFRQRMTLTLRTRLVPAAPAWLRAGGAVAVDRGEGPLAGQLRLRANGPWHFRKPSGAIVAVTLHLPVPGGVPADGCRQVPVGVRVVADALEVVLPLGWYTGATAITAKGAYRGISERVPDPAVAIQAANGHRAR